MVAGATDARAAASATGRYSASFAGRPPDANSSRSTRRSSSATISRNARSSKRLIATTPVRGRDLAPGLARLCRSGVRGPAGRLESGVADASARVPVAADHKFAKVSGRVVDASVVGGVAGDDAIAGFCPGLGRTADPYLV